MNGLGCVSRDPSHSSSPRQNEALLAGVCGSKCRPPLTNPGNSLSNYPELSEAYNKGKDEWIQSRDFSKIHCSLAQNGSYYFNNNSGATAKVGQSHDGLDARLGKEINSKLVGGKFVQDPQLVALGIAQSYILLGKNGEILWDLKDHYTDLENVLQESKVGVEVSRGDLA